MIKIYIFGLTSQVTGLAYPATTAKIPLKRDDGGRHCGMMEAAIAG